MIVKKNFMCNIIKHFAWLFYFLTSSITPHIPSKLKYVRK